MRSIARKTAIFVPALVLVMTAIGMPAANASAVKHVGTQSPMCAVDGDAGTWSSGQTVNDGGDPSQCC